jgi:transcriptional regulator with XRE-family HTH domain
MRQREATTYEAMEIEDASGLRQEELIVEVTEALARALRTSGLTRSQLATRLGRTRGFISQVLGGGRNLTLRTLADLAGALGCRVRVNLLPEKRRGARQRGGTVTISRARRAAPRPATPQRAAARPPASASPPASAPFTGSARSMRQS